MGSQARAIARYVKGWKRSDFLDWLSQYGEVTKLDHERGDEGPYFFRSACGLVAGFIWTDEGRFIIIGDNTTFDVTAD